MKESSQRRPSQQQPEKKEMNFDAGFGPAQQSLFRNHHEEEKKSETSEADCSDFHQQHCAEDSFLRQPQHLTPPPTDNASMGTRIRLGDDDDEDRGNDNDNPIRYYKVVYRGVVALLSQPEQSAPRSGCYLSYGEVVKSQFQVQLPTAIPNNNHDDITNNNIAIRVDEILTGGYAFDPPDASSSANKGSVQYNTETPKRSNVQGYSTVGGPIIGGATNDYDVPLAPSPSTTLAISHSASSSPEDDEEEGLDMMKTIESEAMRCQHNGVSHHGFLFCQNKKNTPIIQALPRPPKCEHGRFFYKVMSTTPLPIITGPSLDAPPTKAMALPGTVHEISFRMNISESEDGDSDDGIWFLRLGRRKGYIADRRVNTLLRRGRARAQGTTSIQPESLVKDVTEEYQQGGIQRIVCNIDGEEAHSATSMHSITYTSNATLSTRTRNRRHRPPRRKNDDVSHTRPQGIGRGANTTSRSRVHNNNHETNLANLSVQSHSSDRLVTPSSNVSVLSDDSSFAEQYQQLSFCSHDNHNSHISGALSPDRSVARSVKSNASTQHQQQPKQQTFFLMRVTAPRGLRILDAPHFQVNNLIHGTQQAKGPSAAQEGLVSSGSADVSALSALHSTKNQHHLFHTMAGRITTTTGINPADNAIIFDSVTRQRQIPRGAVFEAAKRMEKSEALFHQGAGLIKLADNSGWVIVPHKEEIEQQYHSGGGHGIRERESIQGFEEIGSAVVYDASSDASSFDGRGYGHSSSSDFWMRVVARGGVHVVCAPPLPPTQDENNSAETSPSSSAANGSKQPDQVGLVKSDSSEVASSVGSSFLDAMFRAPKRRDQLDSLDDKKMKSGLQAEKAVSTSNTIPCGMCVSVEPQVPTDFHHHHHHHQHHPDIQQEYARLRGGGWIPLSLAGKATCILCPLRSPPVSHFGSFWYRVQSTRGLKVRLGPSRRAPSIKSSDGSYFRFECGEFLRASEILTVFHEDKDGRTRSESYAKLYRNRHVRMPGAGGDFRSLLSLTTQAEWVQILDDEKNEHYLQECPKEPRIERHRQGWRYLVVSSSGIRVKKGPSFESEDMGVHIQDKEQIVAIERVVSAEENGVTWLRIKEGGWVNDIDKETGTTLLVSNSLRHRTKAANSRPEKPRRRATDDVDQQLAYNTLIARLFHTDGHGPQKQTQ